MKGKQNIINDDYNAKECFNIDLCYFEMELPTEYC